MGFWPVNYHEYLCLFGGFDCISNFKINNMFQEILAFITLAIAVSFLIRKFFWKKKKKSDKSCGSDDCGCNN
ncbi:MAG: FeoB-associated Cys-rich membrane protein [Flavobacterium sp.]